MNRSNKGFTLIEVIFVVALFALIIGIGAPITVDVYKDYILNTENAGLISLLRRAKSLSVSNTAASNFGLKVQNDSFVVFKGESFSTRDSQYDENYDRAPSVSITGLDEIVFERLTGINKSLSTTTIVLNSGNNSQIIIVNPYGTINH